MICCFKTLNLSYKPVIKQQITPSRNSGCFRLFTCASFLPKWTFGQKCIWRDFMLCLNGVEMRISDDVPRCVVSSAVCTNMHRILQRRRARKLRVVWASLALVALSLAACSALFTAWTWRETRDLSESFKILQDRLDQVCIIPKTNSISQSRTVSE